MIHQTSKTQHSDVTIECTHPPLVQFKYAQKLFILEITSIEVNNLSVFEKNTAILY